MGAGGCGAAGIPSIMYEEAAGRFGGPGGEQRAGVDRDRGELSAGAAIGPWKGDRGPLCGTGREPRCHGGDEPVFGVENGFFKKI